MKKILIISFVLALSLPTFAMDTVFDSMDKATEVKLQPSVSTKQTSNVAQSTTQKATATTNSIQEQKFNSALINLDDAQVELRQDLSVATTKYNEALIEKNTAIANCKTLKKELRTINRKMKNVEKSKKMINKNLETAQ